MQPTENKQPAQEELIAHIRRNLKAHEEPYNLGAWENFNQNKPRKKAPIFWIARAGAVAAVIAICFSIFLLTKNNSNQAENNLVKNKPVEEKQQSENEISENKAADELISDQSTLEQSIASTAGNSRFKSIIKDVIENLNPIAVTNENTIVNNQVALNNDPQTNSVQNNMVVTPKAVQEIAMNGEEKVKSNTMDFLLNEAKKNEGSVERMAKNQNKKKWVLGLMIAPSIGNTEELNMGYGVSMGYNFSDKLSLITGVSYNEMSASKNFPTNVGMSSILLNNNKSLAAINQKVSGLDIPLELKYSFNKSVYASLGVSAFAVLGQSRNNTFIQGVVIKNTPNTTSSTPGASAGTSSGTDLSESKGQFANSYIVNQKVVEKAILEDQDDVNYLGFYNFSIGYKRRMIKNHYVALEPFVKLPIRNVTQDNLKLVGAGLRLKIDF